MLRPFMPHQQSAFDWAQSRDTGALFMEMRLGKTSVAIRWAMDKVGRETRARILVVAPSTTLYGWHDELQLEGIHATDIVSMVGMTGPQKVNAVQQPRLASRPTWFLLNYESVWRYAALWQHPWDAIILDESTRIKNPGSKTTKALLNRYVADYRMILTGSPNPEGLENFFTQMCFVRGGSFMGFRNFWGWRDRWFLQIGYEWHPKRGAREAIKQAVTEDAFSMTRKQADIGSVLLRETRTVPMNPAQRKLWREIRKEFKFTSPVTGDETETKYAGARQVWLERIAGGFSPDKHLLSDAKAKELASLLEDELEGEPLVVWFRFNTEIAFVAQFLTSRGYTVTRLTGATSIDDRRARLKKFQTGKAQVILVQEALGQYGLNLSVSDTEVYYSNAWSYEMRTQSQDRIIHPSKRHPLLAIDLVTEGTTDEDVVATLADKRVDANSFTSTLLKRVMERMHGSVA